MIVCSKPALASAGLRRLYDFDKSGLNDISALTSQNLSNLVVLHLLRTVRLQLSKQQTNRGPCRRPRSVDLRGSRIIRTKTGKLFVSQLDMSRPSRV